MNRCIPLILLLAVAGCARSEEASLTAPAGDQGYNQIGKVGTPAADDREPAIGQWRPALQDNVQVLEFGPVGTPPLFSLACTGNRSVLLQRHGGAPTGPLPAMQVGKGQVNESLGVTVGGGTVPMVRAELPLQSPLGQAIGGGGEPLILRLGDGAPLVLPASPMIADYLRTCATARPPVAGEGANAAAPAGNVAAPVAPANGAAPAPAGQPKQ